ncbi:guanylate-binding protein 1 [Sarcophilus harrisii]|uniref:GB1/RHD3-type G domain-containing protein n=1 Tax=Sarcophilus harrisii TaxID=9305 RepID=A0A7N4P9I1_SARHA|nr:guanylate-binding protein 1 [Sarcophilus harrisii]XP_031825229.1 guanylate-binding protein 1 [Sarcophilus harrisii]
MFGAHLMRAPICLIENSNGQFVVNQKALRVLRKFTQPLVVVAIVGLYRTGKSYLMNKLAGRRTGFSLGSTVQSHTKGIWMWCVPHPTKPNHTLVLLDTEGLGDVEKGDNKNDTWIFALAVLLCSTFVYNSMGTIDQQAMEDIYYVTELTDKIKAKSSSRTEQMDDSMELVSLFPDFVWTVRDFILELEIDGQPATPDQYLENALKPKKGTSEEAGMCIQKFFRNKNCFVFAPPAYGKKLLKIEQLHDDELDADFVKSAENFRNHIYNKAKAKTLPGGAMVNGPRLGNLVVNYVEAITSGDIPCMENAVLALAELENSAAVQKAFAVYEKMMRQGIQFPTETIQELLRLHDICEREAINVFIKDSFKDVDQKFQKALENRLKAKLDEFCKQNERESRDRCTALLQDIFRPLEEAVKQSAFSKPGGYDIYLQQMRELQKKYNQQPKKGIQANKILEEYLKSKETVADAIKQADQRLTKKENQRREQERQAQAAAEAARRMEMALRRQEEINRAIQRRQEKERRQMFERMKAENRRLLEEQKRARIRKLEEEARRIQEEQRRAMAEQEQQLQELQQQYDNRSSDSCTIL